MILTKQAKEYLFSKIENRKKKKSIETENELFKLLKGDKTSFNNNDINLIFKSLEYTFRKRLQGDKPDLKNDLFKSIKDKLPKDLFLVKYSNLKSRENKKDKVPTIKNTKKEITEYLDEIGLDYNPKDTKSKLIDLFKEGHIKTFNGFLNS